LQQNARLPNSNLYSSNWTGPPITSLDPYSQIVALHVLIPAFDIVSSNSSVSNATSITVGSPSQSSGPGQSSQPTASHHVSIGPIIGAALGALACLGAASTAFVILRRRRHRQPTFSVKSAPPAQPMTYTSPSRIDPFVSQFQRTAVQATAGDEHLLNKDRITQMVANVPRDPAVNHNTDPPSAATIRPAAMNDSGAQTGGPSAPPPVMRGGPPNAELAQSIEQLINLLATTRSEARARRLAAENADVVFDADEQPPAYER